MNDPIETPAEKPQLCFVNWHQVLQLLTSDHQQSGRAEELWSTPSTKGQYFQVLSLEPIVPPGTSEPRLGVISLIAHTAG